MKNLLFFIFLILFYSCQNQENKTFNKDYESLRQANLSLNVKVRQYEKSIDSLITLKSIDSITQKNQNYTSEDCEYDWELSYRKIDSLKKLSVILKSNLNFATDIFLSKNELIENVFSRIVWDDNQKYNRILWDLSTLANPNRNNHFKFEIENNINDIAKLSNSESRFAYYMHYLWRRFDRSPENIRNFLSEKNKKFILSFFKKNNLYINSGLKDLVKCLLISYKDIGHNKDLLEKLHKRSESIGVLGDKKYLELASPDVKKLLSANNFDDPIVDERTRYTWVYSFWVRRNHENNSEVVYQLIKEIDEYMDLEEIKEEEYEH